MSQNVADDPRILEQFEALLAKLPANDREGRALVTHAFEVSTRLHGPQTRKSGELYIEHPIEVASLLADLSQAPAVIAAGLLHDVLEDTELEIEQLRRLFPAPIPDLVEGVTKISRTHFDLDRARERKEEDSRRKSYSAISTREVQPPPAPNAPRPARRADDPVESLRKMFLAMASNLPVVFIKLCDRLHNMRTLKPLPEDRREAIARETLEIYAPLANRLGIHLIRQELEDLSMYWLYPDEYRARARAIARKRRERESLIGRSIDHVRGYLSEFGHENVEISGRSKHFWSIHQKMLRTSLSLEEVLDLNALRIICDSESQCYEILGLIHAVWSPLPNRIKDYIGSPKPNGYQSLHTTVVGLDGMITEIQIRTREMHRKAEYGVAAHYRYKEGLEPSLEVDRRMEWIRQLTEWITEPGEPDNFLDALKNELFSDVVLCYTPKGDVVELPVGATPIDFAFAVHTIVGEECVGARINGRIASLSTRLRHGDIVEVLRSSKGHPSRDWLDVVATSRARSKIKHWLKSRDMELWVSSGREALLQILKERNIDITRTELEDHLREVLDAYRLKTVEDLLAEIGFRSISPHAAITRMNPEWSRARRAPRKRPARPARRTEELVEVEGDLTGLQVRLAACCKPIPGDDIVGFVTRGRGISIHTLTCPNMARLTEDPGERERMIAAKWNLGQEGESALHTIQVRVYAEDRGGLLADLSEAFAKRSVNIIGVNSRSYESKGTAGLTFSARVANLGQLDEVLTSLRNVPGVLRAERTSRGAV